MDFLSAFRTAFSRSGLTEEQLAVRLGVRVSTVYRWGSGSRIPNGPLWQQLRNELPGFADLIDGKAVA